jgi:ornithine cyclodeaminase/alanine dehydrogenase-like protein (mu-crystallin family)
MSADLLVATAEDVYAAISMQDGIGLMRKGFVALANGRIDQPLRTIIKSPLSSGFLGLMPACVDDPDIYSIPVYGAKIGTLFPENTKIGKDPHQGSVMLMSGITGETLAILDACSVTALRTAAVTGLATSLLANPEASTLTLFGTGHQAFWQLQAIAAVRTLTKVFVVSRDIGNAQKFAHDAGNRNTFAVEATDNVQSALAASDIVVTATNSAVPVLRNEWIKPGTHITAMGASTPSYCEIDGATMAAATLFVDLAASTKRESGEYLNAMRDGYLNKDSPLTELSEVIVHPEKGRTSKDQVTLFKSLGLAFEDVIVAAELHRRHVSANAGIRVKP